MDILSRIKRGTSDLPPRILIAGTEGIGKSTLSSHAPSPLFIASEDGLVGFDHLPRFVPSGMDDLHQLLDMLITNINGYKSIVIDTSDNLERILIQAMCKRDNKSDITDYGYGKGFDILESEFVKILQKLDAIRHKHKVWIILLAHVEIKSFTDPRGGSWDRFQMKGQKKVTGLLREWSDLAAFAVYEVHKTKLKGDQKETAVGGSRVLHTTWSPAFDAKNRLNLPEVIPLDWDELEQAIKDNSVSSLAAKVRELYKAAKIPEAEKPKWEKAMAGLDTMTADRLQSAITKLEAMK